MTISNCVITLKGFLYNYLLYSTLSVMKTSLMNESYKYFIASIYENFTAKIFMICRSKYVWYLDALICSTEKKYSNNKVDLVPGCFLNIVIFKNVQFTKLFIPAVVCKESFSKQIMSCHFFIWCGDPPSVAALASP